MNADEQANVKLRAGRAEMIAGSSAATDKRCLPAHRLASVIVVPANLVWRDAKVPVAAVLLTVLSAGLSALLLVAAGRVLRRTGLG